MRLPVAPPLLPMLAKRVSALPEGDGWVFEPKWDGFRVLVFRDGDERFIQSRDEKPLDRYFPELAAPIAASLPPRCVVDGEVVVAHDGALDFEALQMRIHPAASRIKRLSTEIPASIVLWDLLCLGDRDLRNEPFRERRAALEQALKGAAPPIHVTPATTDRAVAADWFNRFEGAGLDGVMAKPARGAYEPNKRVMFKVKHERECDCVVAGFRWHKGGEGTAIGSLLLGLYDAEGALQHVGVTASFTADARRKLVATLEPYRAAALVNHPWARWAEWARGESRTGGGEGSANRASDATSAEASNAADAVSGAEGRGGTEGGGSAEGRGGTEGGGSDGGSSDAQPAMRRMPGGVSRWSQGKDLSWEPVRPELVVQVAYDHMQGSRFRHTAQFRRWRPDKAPRDCTYEQLEVVPAHELASIFA